MQEIWDRLGWLLDALPGAAAKEDGGDVTLRIPTGPGVVSFVAFEADPYNVFNPVRRLAVETLVATETPPSDATADFLTESNAAAFGGSWQRFSNGDVGVVGSVLVHEASAASLATLLPQLLALQVRDALEVGRPAGGRPIPDADGDPPPALEVWEREVPVDQLVDLLTWRSAHHPSHRFAVVGLDDGVAELLVPSFVGDPLRTAAGDVVGTALRLTIARTDHPRRGQGTLLQVPLASSVQADAADHLVAPWAHEPGRWHGTSLGSLLRWSGGDAALQVVYRTFVPDALLSVLPPSAALDRLVDVALGVVNRAGAASAAIASLAAGEQPQDLEPRLRRDKRVAQLRACVPITSHHDGLVDVDGPVVEVGRALLDRLAVDQLQVHTAAHAVDPDGFVWLPIPFTQSCWATRVQASRFLEVSFVRLVTRLGACEPAAAEVVSRRCVELASESPMAALLVDDDGTVDLVSTFMMHEGVWHHRSSLVAITAAMHTNLAGPLAASLHATGVRPSRHAGFEDLDVDTPDTIVDVVPDLLGSERDRLLEPRDAIAHATTTLRTRPGARQLEGGSGPDVILPLRVLSDAGGVDPVLGEVAVFLDPVDHPQAGPCVRITVHPGYPTPLDETDLPIFAAQLTREAHAHPAGAFVPAWEVDRQVMVATMTVPCLALAQLTAPGATFADATALLVQTIDATVAAVAAAVERHPTHFPGFDRSQLNLRDGHGTPLIDHLDGYALWAPQATWRRLAVRLDDTLPQRWSAVSLPRNGVDALASWIERGPHDRFAMDGVQLVAEHRGEQGVHLWLPHGIERQVALDDLPTLAAMLRHAEAPAIGMSDGPVVLTPLDIWGDDDTVYLLLPPAPTVTAVLARDTSCDGITAITHDAVWVGLRSPAGTVHVELLRGLVDSILQAAGGARSIPVEATVPAVDPRVAATTPPPPTRFELSTSRLRDALDHIPS